MEAKVLKMLVKWGHNKEMAQSWIDEHLEEALRMFPEATPAQLADIVRCL